MAFFKAEAKLILQQIKYDGLTNNDPKLLIVNLSLRDSHAQARSWKAFLY